MEGHVEPPWSETSEITVLGACMIDPDAVAEVRGWLRSEHFFAQKHRFIYEAVVKLFDAGEAVDVVMVHDALGSDLGTAGGPEYLHELQDSVAHSGSIRHHAGVVLGKAKRRKLVSMCQETIREAMEDGDTREVVRHAEERFLSMGDDGPSAGLVGMRESVTGAMELVDRATKAKGGILGIPSGLPTLDHWTTGWAPGELTILAARPSMGKTAMAWGMADHAASKGHGTAFMSYETSREVLVLRGIAQSSGVDMQHLRTGRVSPEASRQVSRAAGRIQSLPLWIDDRSAGTVGQLKSVLMRHRTRHPIALVMVDYLQLMEGKGDNRTQQVGSVSRGLKSTAKDLGVHVLALAQLSRGPDHRSPPRPMLSDLRDSGEIEQDADNVLLLWRPEWYFDDDTPDEVRARWTARGELIMAKQRNGRTGTLKLHWNAPTLRFSELEREVMAA